MRAHSRGTCQADLAAGHAQAPQGSHGVEAEPAVLVLAWNGHALSLSALILLVLHFMWNLNSSGTGIMQKKIESLIYFFLI
jgi:hypothetical protein